MPDKETGARFVAETIGDIVASTRQMPSHDGAPGAGAAPSDRAPIFRAGDVVGDHFAIERRLGAGGMGQVFLARDVDLGRRVCLKALHAPIGARLGADEGVKREARTLSQLNHPNVVTVYGFGVHDETTYMAMEYVEGRTLAAAIRANLPQDRAAVLHVLHQIASALSHAHGVGVIHRDVKPENVLITAWGSDPWHVKVADFGLAQLADARAASPAGTPGYIAPEQLRGRPADARADVYGFGALAYELLTGVRPYGALRGVDLLSEQLKRDPRPAWEVGDPPSVGRDAGLVLLRALAREPAERYRTVEAFVAALELALSRSDGSGSRPVGEPHSGDGQLCEPGRIAATLAAPPIGQLGWCSAAVMAASIEIRGAEGRPLYRGERAEATQLVYGRVLQEVHRAGGRLTHGLGTRVVAVFGAASSGDVAVEAATDAALGVRAALERMEHDPTLTGAVSIDLCVGVDCGALLMPAAPNSGLPLVWGEGVERAEALCASARAGEVLASHRAMRHVLGVYGSDRRDPHAYVQVRHRRPAPLLVAARPLPLSAAPLHGRALEVGLLQRALHRTVSDRQAVLVPIVGPTGVGKSRLAWELLSRSEARLGTTGRIDVGRCSPNATGSPYEPFREIVRARLRQGALSHDPEQLDAALCAELVRSGLSRDVARGRAAAVTALLDLRAPTPELGVPDTKVNDQASLFSAVCDLFAASTRAGPLIVLIEDFHWARAPTRELLAHVLKELSGEPLVVLLTLRPGAGEDPMADLGCPVDRFRPVHLSALDKDAADALILALLGAGADVPGGLVSAVREASGRLPLYIEELVELLLERGVVGGPRANEGDIHQREPLLAASLDEVLLSRVGALAPALQSILRRHAVVGNIAWRALLAPDSDPGEESWARLRMSGFLQDSRRSRIDGAHEVSFRHSLLREVIYRHLPPRWRREEHRRVAGWLEQRADHPGAMAELILYHWERAEAPAQAARYALRAGHRAANARAGKEALELYERALQLAREDTAPAASLRACAREAHLARAKVGVLAEAPDRTLQAITRAEQDPIATTGPGAALFRAQLQGRRADVAEVRGRFDQALDLLDRAASSLSPEADSTTVRLELESRRANLLARRGRLDEARALGESLLAAFEADVDLGAPTNSDVHQRRLVAAIGRVHAALGHAHADQGRLDLAQQHYERSQELWSRTGFATAAAAALLHLGNLAYRRGDLSVAIEWWTRAADRYADAGSLHGVALASTNLGEAALQRGDLQVAVRRLRDARRTFEALGQFDALPETRRLLAECWLALDQLSTARAEAEAACRLAREHGLQTFEAPALRTLARVRARSGELADADALLVQAAERFRAQGREAEAEATQRERSRPLAEPQ